MLITVVTTVFLASVPCFSISAAAIASTSSPSTTLRRLVDENGAVGVAIERDAEVAASTPRPSADSTSGCSAPQSRLMFSPSGSTASGTTEAPSSESTSGATRYADAVGAVDRHAQTIERQVTRKRVLDEHVVATDRVVDTERLADLGRRRTELRDRVVGEQPLDLELDVVGQLEPRGGEELDAVVLEGIVRPRDDRARRRRGDSA